MESYYKDQIISDFSASKLIQNHKELWIRPLQGFGREFKDKISAFLDNRWRVPQQRFHTTIPQLPVWKSSLLSLLLVRNPFRGMEAIWRTSTKDGLKMIGANCWACQKKLASQCHEWTVINTDIEPSFCIMTTKFLVAGIDNLTKHVKA